MTMRTVAAMVLLAAAGLTPTVVGQENSDPVAALIRRLDGTDPQDVGAAEDALRALGAAALGPLRSAADSHSLASGAARVLALLGEHVPLRIRLIAVEDEYRLSLGGMSLEQFQQAKHFNLSPPAPAVLLHLELTNTGDKPIAFLNGGDDSRVDLDLQGAGAWRGPDNNQFAAVIESSPVAQLAPGETLVQTVTRLSSGYRGSQHFDYWTAPGVYTLTAELHTRVSPVPPGAEASPEARAGGMGVGVWGMPAVFRSPPLTLKVAPADPHAADCIHAMIAGDLAGAAELLRTAGRAAHPDLLLARDFHPDAQVRSAAERLLNETGFADPPTAPLALHLVAHRTAYTIDPGARSPADYRRDLEERRAKSEYARADQLPAAPAVELDAEIENTASFEVTLAFTEDSAPRFILKGPGVVEFSVSLRSSGGRQKVEEVKLAPGGRFSIPIRSLGETEKSGGQRAYWVAPGEYRLAVALGIRFSPVVAGGWSKPSAQRDPPMTIVRLKSPPVTLQVVEK